MVARDAKVDRAFRPHDLIKLIRGNLTVCIGFACLTAWPWFITSTTLAGETSISIGSNVWIGSNLTYLFIGISGIVIAIVQTRSRHQYQSIWRFSISALCYLFSTASFFYLLEPSDAIPGSWMTVISITWPIACGFGQAFMYLSWIRVWGKLGPRPTAAIVVGASILGAVTLLALNFAPQRIREIAVIVTGPLGVWCAYRASQASEPPQIANPTENQARRLPWKLLVTSLVGGFAFGTFQSLSIAGSFGEAAWNQFGIAAFVLAALLLMASVFLSNMDFNHMIYHLAFVIMGVGATVSLVFPNHPDWGYGLFCLGYRYFEAICWCLCAYLIAHENANPVFIGGSVVGALWLGRYGGFELITQLTSLGADSIPDRTLPVVLFLLLAAALFLVGRNNLLEAWGMKRPGEINAHDIAIEHACRAIAHEASLSDREQDVLLLAAQGLGRKEIGDRLSLSGETIKTHMSHIYQKLGIHSRQELDSLIRDRARQCESMPIDIAV